MLLRHAGAGGATGIAREWNRLRIANVGPRGCFEAMVRSFGLSTEVVDLAEVLYKKGVLGSVDILDALSTTQNKS